MFVLYWIFRPCSLFIVFFHNFTNSGDVVLRAFFFTLFSRIFKQAKVNFIIFKAIPNSESVTFPFSDFRIFHPALEYLI